MGEVLRFGWPCPLAGSRAARNVALLDNAGAKHTARRSVRRGDRRRRARRARARACACQARAAGLPHRADRCRAGTGGRKRSRGRPRARALGGDQESPVGARSLGTRLRRQCRPSNRSRSPTARSTLRSGPISSASTTSCKQNGASAFMVEHGELAPRARRRGRRRAGHRDLCVRPRDGLHRDAVCRRRCRSASGERDRGQSSRRRRRQALASPRARRHQMRRLVLSANRHRDHGRACAAASRQGRAAFPSLRTLRHSPAHRQPLVHRVDRGRDAKARPSWRPTKRAFSTSSPKRFGHRLGDIALAGPRQSFPLDMQIARAFVGGPARADRRRGACGASAGGAGAQYRHARRRGAGRDRRRSRAARSRYRQRGRA